MSFIADLHIHSKYSRACSKKLDPSNINAWCQVKGIDLVATADFTHPAWFKEIHKKLEEIDGGVYRLRKEFVNESDVAVPDSCRRDVKFILSTEISLIYKKGDKCRKVHHVVLAPSFDVVSKINVALEKRGNIHSDGRPILGMDSKELLKLLLDISPDVQLIPAHVWTPHFAIFGSKTGFDSVEECFEEMSDHICALETGLSSDPPMNWRLKQNDKYVLVSNSDAHSLEKLGREATIFDCDCNYPAILHTLRKDHSKVKGTIEFFPEEGKYHADGLRSEGLCWTPEESGKYNGVSPKSGKQITIGVLNRVSALADRSYGERPKSARDYWNIIPLKEILSEILGVGVASKKVIEKYNRVIAALGSEFEILKDVKIENIRSEDAILAEAIKRMRKGNVIIQPGYDGEYGVIKIFKEGESLSEDQLRMF